MSELEIPPAGVLIVAGDDDTAGRWARRLRQDGFAVWAEGDDWPAGADVQVILTDGGPEDARRRLLDLCRDTEDVGVVAVGNDGPADVQIPADATEREISLACRLLAEIVRLRRKLRAGGEARRVLSRLAMTDHLTGLPNRREWESELARRRAAAAETDGRLVVGIIDLDHFKLVNDRHGHDVGDRVLQGTASAIRADLRCEDFVARTGGDEFALLLSGLTAEAARPVIDRVRAAIADRLAAAGLPTVTASAGCCVFEPDSNRAHSDAAALALADRALRTAKQSGRNQSVLETVQ